MLLTRIQSQKFIQSPYTPFRLTSIQFYPQWFRRPIFSPPRGSLAPEPLQIESLTICTTEMARADRLSTL